MSVCGYQIAVKGIIANFLGRNGIALEADSIIYSLTCSSMSYKVQTKRLPSGLAHAVVILRLALPASSDGKLNRFLIITKDGRDVRTLFFRHLDEKTELPLHPSWTGWLWNTFEQEGWITEQTTLAGNFTGYLFNFHPTHLQDLISEAIRERVPEIVKCMTY